MQGSERVVAFYNHRGTAEQYIKEGKYAIKWTRLSCSKFRNNEVRGSSRPFILKRPFEAYPSMIPLTVWASILRLNGLGRNSIVRSRSISSRKTSSA